MRTRRGVQHLRGRRFRSGSAVEGIRGAARRCGQDSCGTTKMNEEYGIGVSWVRGRSVLCAFVRTSAD